MGWAFSRMPALFLFVCTFEAGVFDEEKAINPLAGVDWARGVDYDSSKELLDFLSLR
jgi:hypothetical protein